MPQLRGMRRACDLQGVAPRMADDDRSVMIAASLSSSDIVSDDSQSMMRPCLEGSGG